MIRVILIIALLSGCTYNTKTSELIIKPVKNPNSEEGIDKNDQSITSIMKQRNIDSVKSMKKRNDKLEKQNKL